MMPRVFEVQDKSGRSIYLTDERWNHILKHPEMERRLHQITTALIRPDKIVDVSESVKYYYTHDKHRPSKAKWLRVIVKYLNGEGYIITSYFVDTP